MVCEPELNLFIFYRRPETNTNREVFRMLWKNRKKSEHLFEEFPPAE